MSSQKHHLVGSFTKLTTKNLINYICKQPGTTGECLTLSLVSKFINAYMHADTEDFIVLELLEPEIGKPTIILVTKDGFMDCACDLLPEIWSIHIVLSNSKGFNLGIKATWDASFRRMSFK